MKVLAIAILLISASATADGYSDSSSRYSIGARVGGYGFRRAGDSGSVEGALGNAWSECRMNGIGLFVDRALPHHLFLEGGLDTYFTLGQGQPTDLPLDRQSLLLSVAIGARVPFTRHVGGYIQVGGGTELTRLSVPYGADSIRAERVYPEGFAGLGLDVRLGARTVIGATLRALVMANFNYQMSMPNPWVATPSPDQVFAATPSLAAQAQFYLRRDL